jgi:integrase
MSLYKRKNTWWTDFSVNGQRFRESLDTSDWREAQAKEKQLIAQASQGKLTSTNHQFSRLAFGIAVDEYLASRRLELSKRSLTKEKHLLIQPSRFFGAVPLHKITTDQLQAYREQRAAKGLSHAFINMEMGAIRRILKRAKRWHIVGEELRPLKEKRQVGRALTDEEKSRLLKLAATNPDWQTVRWASILALNTTMRGCELKNLLWRDVSLLDRTLTIRHSKTEAGERVIPLNEEAIQVVQELLKRAETLEAAKLDNYVFPACENNKINPMRPQTTWRTAWRRLTRAVNCPACHLLQDPAKVCSNANCKLDISNVKSPTEGLRFHDLRHHAITELAESQASEQTIMAIAGHVSRKMLAHYSHVRLDAKRKALAALSQRSKEQGYGTNNDTNASAQQSENPQVVEINGRPVGTRTPDLYRVKVAL